MPDTRTAAIIAVGSEMLGTTRVDTNSLKITAALETHGVALTRKSVVGDDVDALVAELEFCARTVSIIIVSGGLGPTDDDRTRDALARAFDLQTETDESIVARIEARFAARGWKMPEVNRRQAVVFRGQSTLPNGPGTAPGFHIEARGCDIFVFPGVPHELEWMIGRYFAPWLAQFGAPGHHRRILKVAGLSESGVEEKLAPYYAAHPGELVTILASPAAVEVHAIAAGTERVAQPILDAREQEIRALLGFHVFGVDDDTLEAAVGRLLAERSETVATAESCTGGLVAMRLTEVPGSSRYFRGGVVVYDAAAKEDLASVDPELIRAHGQVSEAVAVALARGVRARFDTTYGIGITGIAGPDGGTPEKPVGTVHIAIAGPGADEHRRMLWSGTTRHLVRWFSSQTALDLLRKTMTAGEA